MTLFLRLTISPILFYYSLTYLQLLTLWITRFFRRDSLVSLVQEVTGGYKRLSSKRDAEKVSINGKALRWFKSYLENRKQVVNVKGATSCRKDLRCGVPQGSVLEPILYVLYTSPLGDIVRSHGLSCHFYADDTQLYCPFKLHDQAAAVQAIESCLNDIDAWMLANMLKLNRDKTELLVIGPKHKVNPPIKGIHVAGEYIEVSNNARN